MYNPHHQHPENDPSYKGLSVNEGVQDAPINPYAKPRRTRKHFTPAEYGKAS